MIRFASYLVAALACTLCTAAALAQESTADLVTRIDRLEAAIRQLTGSVEQLQYRNQQLELQVRRQQEPSEASAPRPLVASPPRSAGAYPPGSNVGTAPGVPGASAAPIEPPPPSSSGRRNDAFDPTASPTAPGAPRPLGASTTVNEPPPIYERPASDATGTAPGPRPLGAPLNLSNLSARSGGSPSGNELPPPPPTNTNATGPTLATLPPGNSSKDQYDLGYGYVQHRDYALAADTFRSFLRQYPSDRLAPEAQYWLGESLFQQQQYRDAAESFLAVSTKYDATARAPEALLRLGQSLAALGEKEAACASLGEVLRKYPRAPQNVKQGVEREQKRGHC
jgi:tol-pal system protein YbgF